ncbi:hypothetical protein DACRYDRAFT_120016 [Dacryopinax primogenitus]|uniref:Uncharacterized protein n=1 Tax=Dacryopinax primogenitus (strain DJM 731) TaxID=1858805 RepID=M5FNV6_DACPD|nr:uncharacterized protein DACRYDRAFT_120016 [Dacryopinax primogenitus]EJT96588.1 hypothetical protein DACRYDRAFT_120016 [Dacryopinax primogenitus]
MASSDLHRSATTAVPEDATAPPAFSRSTTAASPGESGFSASETATAGEMELEATIREKEKLLEEARRERLEIERKLAELESLREEVGKKVELAGIARKVFAHVTEEETHKETESEITPLEIATYWDSLAEDIQGLDTRLKEKLGFRDYTIPSPVQATHPVNGEHVESAHEGVDEEDGEDEDETPEEEKESQQGRSD